MLTNKSINNKKVSKFKYNLPLTLLSLPGIIWVIMFLYVPMFGVVLAFKDYNYAKGFIDSDWIGFKYFIYFFKSSDAVRVIRNTVLYHVWFQIISTVFSVMVALFLYDIKRKNVLKVYQTSILIPNFMSWVLVAYIGFTLFSNNYGIINSAITFFNRKPIDFYTQPGYWPLIFSVFYIWKTIGISCIIYYASLMGMDPGLIEAAKIDGAGRGRIIWNIMLPSLLPVIVMLTIMSVGSIMSGDFGMFYQLPKQFNLFVLFGSSRKRYAYGTKNRKSIGFSRQGRLDSILFQYHKYEKRQHT